MRVALVSDYWLDFVGGAQSSVFEQKAALESAGHTVALVAPAHLPRGIRSQEHGAGFSLRPAFTVPGENLPVVGAGAGTVELLRGYFERTGVEVVHAQTEFGLAHAAVSAADALGIPAVNTVHTFYWRSEGVLPTLVTPIIRFGLARATRAAIGHKRFSRRPSDDLLRNVTLALCERTAVVVSPSAHQAGDLAAAGLRTPITVVPNPIARSPRPPAELDASHTARPRLLWVARCEPEKRPLEFARAVIAALDRLGDVFEVDFVGDGGELAALRSLTAAHPSIRVHGALGHDAVLELMDAASLVALTSVGFDNQPMTIAEAVSRWRGVLYCDPLLREGLEAAGHRTHSPAVADLTEAIVELVGDPARLIALSAGAKLDSVMFSAASYVERIMAVYREARENSHAPHLAAP